MEINILYIARHHLLLLVYCALNCFQRNINKNNCFFFLSLFCGKTTTTMTEKQYQKKFMHEDYEIWISRENNNNKLLGFSPTTEIPFSIYISFFFLLYRFMKDNAFPISSYLKSVFVECTVSFVFFVQSIHYSPLTNNNHHLIHHQPFLLTRVFYFFIH